MKVLQFRIEKIKEEFRPQLYCYNKYRTLAPTITYQSKNELVIERRLKYDEKLVSYSDVLKHVRNKDHVVVISGESGIGKTFLANELMNKLAEGYSQINIVKIMEMGSDSNKYRTFIE